MHVQTYAKGWNNIWGNVIFVWYRQKWIIFIKWLNFEFKILLLKSQFLKKLCSQEQIDSQKVGLTEFEFVTLFSRKILIFENLRIFEVENFPFSVVFPEEMFSAEDDELRDAKNCNLDQLLNWTRNSDLGVFKNFSPQKKMWQGIYNEFKISIFSCRMRLF